MPSSLIAVCPSCPTGSTWRHRCATYPSSSVTDTQWAVLEPLLPPPGNRGGRGGRNEKHCRRTIIDAIFYVVRGGIAWRQMPSDFPPATTVYAVFTRWVRTGAWHRIHDALRDRERVAAGRHPLPTAAIIDSQSVQGGDTVHRSTRGYDAGKKTNGRKRHIVVDTNGLLLAAAVTPGSIQDRDGAARVLAALRASLSTITLVWDDGGYTGRLVVWRKLFSGWMFGSSNDVTTAPDSTFCHADGSSSALSGGS